MNNNLIEKQAAIDTVLGVIPYDEYWKEQIEKAVNALPSAQPEYKPVTAEDFAKTMSENTIWEFAVWHGEALALMKEQGFVICKKTM